MKQVSELEGAELDYWAAKAEGLSISEKEAPMELYDDREAFSSALDMFNLWPHREGYLHPSDDFSAEYSPSSYWSQGGPIIEREGIGCVQQNNLPESEHHWRAVIYLKGVKLRGSTLAYQFGPTPLIAAMRARIAAKYGEEVE